MLTPKLQLSTTIGYRAKQPVTAANTALFTIAAQDALKPKPKMAHTSTMYGQRPAEPTLPAPKKE